MKYRLKLNEPVDEMTKLIFKDKEITKTSKNKVKKEIEKELETWLTYGEIKDSYIKKYHRDIVKIINDIISKYHKKYKGLWEQAEILEKKYAETDLEEMEEAYEVTMTQVQKEKNKLFHDIVLPELNEALDKSGMLGGN